MKTVCELVLCCILNMKNFPEHKRVQRGSGPRVTLNWKSRRKFMDG